MSTLIRFHLCRGYRERARELCPAASPADLAALDDLVRTDRMVDDAGAAHPALVDWARGVLDRRPGDDADGVAVLVGPVPKTGPTGVEVMA